MPVANVYGIHADARAVEMLPGVVRRTLVVGETMLLCEFEVPAGSGVPPHSHPHEQSGYVVRGRFEFTIGDQVRVLGPGDAYLIPGNLVHSTRAIEDSVVIDIFSPVRDEYV